MPPSPVILIYTRAPAPWRDWLLEHACPGTLLTASTPDEALRQVAEVEVILGWGIPAEVVQAAPRLTWVQNMGAGVERLIPAMRTRPEVRLTRIIGQFGVPMSEYVFAELLAHVRRVDVLRRLQERHEWEHIPVGTLNGTTIGIAGLGDIGTEMVRKARAFDMHVYGLSRSGAHATLVDRHFGPDEWCPFVRDLHFLVLVLPLTPETEGVVDARVLHAMRPDAVLVNVGRGRSVVEEDLISALREGRIGGAVLDVFAQEPLPTDSPFWDLPHTVVTPHVSGPSQVADVGRFFLENLRRWERGEPLLARVDLGRGY